MPGTQQERDGDWNQQTITTEEPMPFAEEPDLPVADDQTTREEEEEIDRIITSICEERPKNSTDAIIIEETPEKPQAASKNHYSWTTAPPSKEISSSLDPKNIVNNLRRRHVFLVTVTSNPKAHKQAMASANHHNWKEAKLKEIANMIKHHVWKVRARLPLDEPIPATWAYRKKLGADNQIIEWKARICAQGFKQVHGLNFEAKYVPTGKPSSLRFLLSFAVNNDLKIHQLDVCSAFLMCPLDDQVTLIPPAGLDCPEGSVLDPNKAIYGLRQAPLVWYKRLSNFLKSIDFQILLADPCVFWRTKQPNKQATWIFAHVDDLVIIS
jgi:hypothetical protein